MAPELPPTLLGDSSHNENIICLMTKTGGHVGWAQVYTLYTPYKYIHTLDNYLHTTMFCAGTCHHVTSSSG
jgi:predicted alpha/beta-fold hydrolase